MKFEELWDNIARKHPDMTQEGKSIKFGSPDKLKKLLEQVYDKGLYEGMQRYQATSNTFNEAFGGMFGKGKP